MRTLLAAVSLAAVCASMPAPAYAQEDVYDPWEGFNRNMFAIHEAIDKAVLEPVARGYHAVVPGPVRGGVRNFLHNLQAPVIFANDVLQGEVKRAGVTAGRFGVNSTVGLLGILDPATDMGLERHDEDFGQTLAVWGVKSGPYLFIPLVGPTSLRDGIGSGVDLALDPINYAEFDGDDTFRTSRLVVGGISAREGLLDTIDGIRQDSIDPYATIRNAYGLVRYSAVQNGRQDVQALPEFEEIPDDTATTPETTTPEGDAATTEQTPETTAPTTPKMAPTPTPKEKSK